MTTKIYSVDWAHDEEKLSVWNGIKVSHKLPKPEGDIVIVTENMPNKMAKAYLQAGIPVLRCSPNSSAEYRERYNYEKTDDNDSIIIMMLYRSDPSKFRKMKEDTRLKQLYVNYEQLKKQIVSVKNRQWAAEDEDNRAYLEVLENAKTLLTNKINKELKTYPIFTTFLTKIKGIGPALAAALISEVRDIKRFENVSDLYAYFGVHVKNGACLKRTKGQVANWNSTGRSLICELIPDQFVRQNSPVYRGIYDAEKIKCIAVLTEDAELPMDQRRVKSKLHAERRARRKAGKIFLHHFWKEWRILEGLSVPEPWILAQGGHSHEILPPTAYPGLT